MSKAVVKKKKRLEDSHAESVAKKVKSNPAPVDPKHVSGGEIRGIIDETLARTYNELFPSMSTTDEDGNVDVEIREEAYIITLDMVVGNDIQLPRTGLKLREDKKIADTAVFCKAHR